MRRYKHMLDWWSNNGPPVYIAVAGYLGLIKEDKAGSQPKAIPKPKESGNLNDLLKMAGSGGFF